MHHNFFVNMRILVLITFLYTISTCAWGQIIDNFSDGDFIENPNWEGENNAFVVNQNLELQLNDSPVTKQAYLSLSAPFELSNLQWSFRVVLDFNPSGSNQLKIFLHSDSSNLKNTTSGYYLLIGESGNEDGIDLYRKDIARDTLLIEGIDGTVSLDYNEINIKVIIDSLSNWSVWADTSQTENYILQGTTIDSTYKFFSYFGFLCSHTASRSDKFFFDNIYIGDIYIDNTPPTLDTLEVLNKSSVQLTFSEALNLDVLTSQNFSLDNSLLPDSITIISSTQINLFFSDYFNHGFTHTIYTYNITDLLGNINLLDSFSFIFHDIHTYDIIINEIFADPSPVIDLPESEYIEIYNSTNHSVNLANWTISDLTSVAIFPNVIIPAKEYLIVAKLNNVDSFINKGWNNVVGLNSFPSLNNSTDLLTLRDNNGKFIDDVEYYDSWHTDELKKLGGWSLEVIDPLNPCAYETNWASSIDAIGGTPGFQNSIFADNPDISPPEIEKVYPTDSTHLAIQFTEPLDSISLYSTENYTIDHDIGHPQNIFFNYNNKNKITLEFSTNFKSQTVYTLSIANVSDCKINRILSTDIEFGLPEPADSLDLVINEILFNPATGGGDFIELYNRSNKIVDLSTLRIATLDADGNIDQINILFEEPVLFFPDTYYAFTENFNDLKNQYLPKKYEQILEVPKLPSMADDYGHVALLNKHGLQIDNFKYEESMHLAILDNVDGVSLERISFNNNSNDPNNWHSAASSVNYATPGYQNSTYQSFATLEKIITLIPENFSPDNDGYDDFITIQYNLNEPGYIANIQIYDVHGNFIKEIADNDLLATKGFYTWDGINMDNRISAEGIYIVFAQVFNTSGKKMIFKEPFVLESN